MVAQQTHTVIVGASVAGLAMAVMLKSKKIPYLLIEKHDRVATPWRNHYHRLHLHTSKGLSHLPFKKFGKEVPRYPSRQEVVDYLEEYQEAFDINPIFNTEALSIRREAGAWITKANHGNFISKCLVMATGAYGEARSIDFPGTESFPGKILHSSEYKSGKDFTGQDVLVVGFGNSGCEIAIDLVEQGANPSIAVRSAVNVVPRDILGIPILGISLLMNPFPPRVADIMNEPLLRWLVGDIRKLGLRRAIHGPLEQIQKEQKVPVLDIGTIALIRKGRIAVFDDIKKIEGSKVFFKDGKSKVFHTIVAAIGYHRHNIHILDVEQRRFEDLRLPAKKQEYFGEDGLYFCGFWVSPTGQIREIAHDARLIASHLCRHFPS